MSRARSISCRVCGLSRKGNRDKFSPDKRSHDGLTGCCKKCYNNWRKEYRQKPENLKRIREYRHKPEVMKRDREYRYLKKYGLTIDQYDQLLNSQGNKCAICGTENPDKKRFNIDHCHLTGKIRGLLCRKCNLLLGFSGDNVETLISAARYLER